MNELHSHVKEAFKSKQTQHGIFRGFVEFINDPLQVGRVKVRIPDIYGFTDDVPTEDLPWAYVSFPFGGGHDFGSVSVPPVGSTVFVMFEHSNTDYPIVVGTWFANPDLPPQMLRNGTNTLPTGSISMSKDKDSPWIPEEGPEIPSEFLLQVNHNPEHHVVFKSVKGATIDIDDRDEKESMNIVDRGGQGLFMSTPISSSKNENNAEQRKLRSANNGNAVDLANTVNAETSLALIDTGSQSIVLSSKDTGNSIVLNSKTDSEPGHKETFGNRNVTLEISSENSFFDIEILKDGKLKGKIRVDGETETLELSSSLLTKIVSSTIFLDGNVYISGNVNVTKSISCSENGLFSGEVLSNTETAKAAIPSVSIPSF